MASIKVSNASPCMRMAIGIATCMQCNYVRLSMYLATLGWYGPRTSHPRSENAMKRMRTQIENLQTLGNAIWIVMNSSCINNSHS